MASKPSLLQSLFGNTPSEPQAKLLTEQEVNQAIEMSTAMQELYGTGLYGRMSSVVDEISMKKLIGIFSEAEAGELGPMIEFYQRMESSDSRLRSIIRNRRLTATRKPFNVYLPEEAENNAVAIKALELVERNIERLNWSNVLQDVLDGRLYGVALFEKVWNESSDGQLFIESINQIEPYRMEQIMDRVGVDLLNPVYGKLRLIESSRDRVMIEDIPRFKMIVATNTSKKGNYDLAGELRPVARWFVIKTFVAKRWAQFAEKYGFPFVSVQIDKNNYDKHKADVKKFIESAGSNRYLIAYDFMDFEIHQANTGASVEVFERLMNMCNLEMTIGILGQSLTTDVGDSGSRALGDVHKEVKDEISEDDNAWIDEIVNAQIVRDIVSYNFPSLPFEMYPVYQTISDKGINLREFAEGVKAITSLVPVGLEWIYEEAQIPRPNKDDEQVGGYKGDFTMSDALDQFE